MKSIAKPDWFGALRRYGKGKPHDMESIRESIWKACKRSHIREARRGRPCGQTDPSAVNEDG